MYNPDLNLMLLHPPKTGGTSIEIMFGMKKLPIELARKYNGGEYQINFKHGFPKEIEDIDSDIWANSTKIITCRNPYNRAVSLYLHFRRFNWIPEDMTFIAFLAGIIYQDLKVKPWQLALAQPQSQWFVPEAKILKLETLHEDVSNLCKSLNTPEPKMLHHNKAHNWVWQDYNTATARNSIYSFYEKDFDVFGYSYNGSIKR